MEDSAEKRRALRALRSYFERRRSPKTTLAAIVAITGLAGFGFSAGLLKLGLVSMWARYPLSVLGAYAVFLGLVRLWVEIERNKIDPDDPEIVAAPENSGENRGKAPIYPSERSWLDWLDLTPDFGSDGCLPAIFLAAIAGLAAVLIAAVGAAPVLLAEVFLDVALAGLLYRRLKSAARGNWLGTAIGKTWLYVLGAAALLAIAGGCLDLMAPGSDSMGKALKEIWRSWTGG